MELTRREKSMINLNLNNHPYKTKTMLKDKKPRKGKKRDRIERCKRHSPGVPPNTCPYIDMVITMVQDLSESYEKFRTKGEHNPVAHRISEQAVELLEYVRANNETLRDNSHYWYNQYKKNV